MGSIWNKLMTALAPNRNLKAVLDQSDATFKKAGSALEHMVTCHKMSVDRVGQLDQQLAELETKALSARNSGLTARASELADEIAALSAQRNVEAKKADDFGATVENLKIQLAQTEAQFQSLRKQ